MASALAPRCIPSDGHRSTPTRSPTVRSDCTLAAGENHDGLVAAVGCQDELRTCVDRAVDQTAPKALTTAPGGRPKRSMRPRSARTWIVPGAVSAGRAANGGIADECVAVEPRKRPTHPSPAAPGKPRSPAVRSVTTSCWTLGQHGVRQFCGYRHLSPPLVGVVRVTGPERHRLKTALTQRHPAPARDRKPRGFRSLQHNQRLTEAIPGHAVGESPAARCRSTVPDSADFTAPMVVRWG
jgi:hypothetical protein